MNRELSRSQVFREMKRKGKKINNNWNLIIFYLPHNIELKHIMQQEIYKVDELDPLISPPDELYSPAKRGEEERKTAKNDYMKRNLKC
jgi:hypothetical protein